MSDSIEFGHFIILLTYLSFSLRKRNFFSRSLIYLDCACTISFRAECFAFRREKDARGTRPSDMFSFEHVNILTNYLYIECAGYYPGPVLTSSILRRLPRTTSCYSRYGGAIGTRSKSTLF